MKNKIFLGPISPKKFQQQLDFECSIELIEQCANQAKAMTKELMGKLDK